MLIFEQARLSEVHTDMKVVELQLIFAFCVLGCLGLLHSRANVLVQVKMAEGMGVPPLGRRS